MSYAAGKTNDNHSKYICLFTDPYFLAKKGQSCDDACAEKNLLCDLAMLKTAALDAKTCRDIIKNLRGTRTYPTGGMYPDEGDFSGCVYAMEGVDWFMLMKPNNIEMPTCNQIPSSHMSRQRVCACLLSGKYMQ